MKERPILFSAPMVRAILEDRKTQTRRVVKPQPPHSCRYIINGAGSHALCFGPGDISVPPTAKSLDHRLPCPYGVPGDRLYVKEACWIWGRWTLNGLTTTGRQRWRFRAEPDHRVRFDRPDLVARRESPQPGFDGLPGWVYRHARFMPRWASRITLEIESVRVERVQEIGEDDAGAEGVSFTKYANANARFHFREIWDTINAARGFGWDANPWVWVVEFRRATA